MVILTMLYIHECVNEAPEAVPNSGSDTNDALLYHVGTACNDSLPCLPFVTKYQQANNVCSVHKIIAIVLKFE